jgi:hypothetical protein
MKDFDRRGTRIEAEFPKQTSLMEKIKSQHSGLARVITEGSGRVKVEKS